MHPQGFDVRKLLELRRRHGDRLVEHLDGEVRPAADLFDVEADVLVPGARPGIIDERRAAALRIAVVAPAANVPYTRKGLETLRRRGVPALADFVCNAGATIGYVAGVKSAEHALRAVEKRVRELTRRSLEHPDGPFAGAAAAAEAALRKWVAPEQMPDGPPLA
jgi:glutamate dehydrogenase/leucine dehydrogenase